MPVRTATATIGPICALTCALAAAGVLPARAQDSPPAQAYSYKRPSPTTITSFKSLYDLCVASNDDRLTQSEHSLCVGYFTGLVDYYLSVTPPASRRFCLPSNPPLTRQDARDRLVLWAGTNPAAATLPAATGVVDFLEANFPCQASGG